MPGPPFLRGDSNGSGSVDLADAIATLSWLFLEGAERVNCPDAADLDDSGTLDLADPILLLMGLFGGRHTISAECAEDPTNDDRLGCPIWGMCL